MHYFCVVGNIASDTALKLKIYISPWVLYEQKMFQLSYFTLKENSYSF